MNLETKRKVIIHITTLDYSKKGNFVADLEIMRGFSATYDIHNFYFYKSDKEPPILLNTPYAEVHNYEDENKLEEKVKLIAKNNDIIYITTTFAINVGLANRLKKAVWNGMSKYPEMFTNKWIQKALLEKDKSISIKYLKTKVSELNFEDLEKKLSLPFILKPINVASWFWVVKIKTEKSLQKYLDNYKELQTNIWNNWFDLSDEIIAEEFVDWKLYSVIYFVNAQGDINLWKPINMKSGADIWINDFFEAEALLTEDEEKSCKKEKLLEFVKRNVELTWIRSAFVRHEFKISESWVYKTIEISAWIWVSALSIHYLAYWVNIFTLLFEEINYKLISNVAIIRLYACKRWILEKIDEKLISKIKKLDSFYKLVFKEEYGIWKEYGLAKDWFTMVATLQLLNKDNKKLKKDLEFIEENYCELLDIE